MELNDILIIYSSYIIIILVGYMLLNLATNGFAGKYLSVKMSFGKKLLVLVNGVRNRYFTTGVIDGDKLSYKNKSKKICAIEMESGDIHRLAGVDCVETEEKTGLVFRNKFHISDEGLSIEIADRNTPEFNAKMVDRAIKLGSLNQQIKPIIILIAIGLVLIGIIYLGVNLSNIKESVTFIMENRGVIQ